MAGGKEVQRPTPWPALDKVEDGYEADLSRRWSELQARVSTICKLDVSTVIMAGRSAKDPENFTFSAEQRSQVMKALEGFLGEYSPTEPESPVRKYYGESYSLGLIQAAQLIGKDRPILDIVKNREIYDELCRNGFDLVKNNATKRIVDQILPEMQAHALAGSNPLAVAARLQKLFGDQNDNWRRLARTEMSISAETAKLKEWTAWGVKRVEYVPAPDACSICMALQGDYDVDKCPIPGRSTHPHCRCSTRPAKSETEREHAPVQAQFTPAKSIKEADAWALENNLADMVSYKGSSVEVANDWNQTIYEHLQQFPELRQNFKFIGTTQERQRKYVELRVADLRTRNPDAPESVLVAHARKEVGKTPGNVWAYATQDRFTKGICVNSKFASDLTLFQAGLDRGVESKFHPVGCNTVKSVVDHEIGHQLDNLLGIRKSAEFSALITEYFNRTGLSFTEALSRYAADSPAEMIAEAWAEFRNNESPRELSLKIAHLVEQSYTARYGGVS